MRPLMVLTRDITANWWGWKAGGWDVHRSFLTTFKKLCYKTDVINRGKRDGGRCLFCFAWFLTGENCSCIDTDAIEKDPIEREEQSNRWSKGYSLMRIIENREGWIPRREEKESLWEEERHLFHCNRKEGHSCVLMID